MSAMFSTLIREAAKAATSEFSWLWGGLVPGLILGVSVLLTLMLYKYFSKAGR